MLHEHWREYTNSEILEIKRKVCIAHECVYLKNFNSDEQINAYCDYLCMTGHIRKERPEDCEHWKDDYIPKKFGRSFLTKEEHDWIKEQVPNVGRPDHYGYHLRKTLN